MSCHAKGCIDCDEGRPEQCSDSSQSCGHHCIHSWGVPGECCWCGTEWGDGR